MLSFWFAFLLGIAEAGLLCYLLRTIKNKNSKSTYITLFAKFVIYVLAIWFGAFLYPQYLAFFVCGFVCGFVLCIILLYLYVLFIKEKFDVEVYIKKYALNAVKFLKDNFVKNLHRLTKKG